jgi:diacylglycerol kinase family enzyme
LLAQDARLLDRMCAMAAGRCRVHVTGRLDELDAVAREIARRGSDLVLLAGGDGSLMAGVSALCRYCGDDALPTISPVPAGTVATVARNWGIAGKPVDILGRMLGRPRRLARRPSLRVHAAATGGEGETRTGFIVGTGLVARFFQVYYEHGAPGYAGSARIVARIFAESFLDGPFARRVLAPLPCSLVVDGKRCGPEAWSLVCCATVRNLGIHMLVNHRAAEDWRRPHLVATPLHPRQLGPRAPLVLLGKPIGGVAHVDRLVERFEVRFPGDGGPYVLDGELCEARSVTVSAGPAIPIALPA